MKRELARLIRRLIELASVIKNHVESISKNQNANNYERQPPPEGDVKAHITLPVSVTDYYEAENSDGHGKYAEINGDCPSKPPLSAQPLLLRFLPIAVLER